MQNTKLIEQREILENQHAKCGNSNDTRCPQIEAVLEYVSTNTLSCSNKLDKERQQYYSQYFTPMAIARQMANMITETGKSVIGDHGAGTGILGAAVLAYHYHKHNTPGKRISLKAYEIDSLLHPVFKDNLSRVIQLARICNAALPEISLEGDFLNVAEDIFEGEAYGELDAVILNPPYQKINQTSAFAKQFKVRGISVPNVYVAFIVLSIMMLKDSGELVAIVPRSFCNGKYFYSFRKWLKGQGSIDWFVRFSKRSNCFRNENVLQENIIFRFRKNIEQSSRVRVSLCDTPDDEPIHDALLPASEVFPVYTDHFFLPANSSEISALHALAELPFSFGDLGLHACTGKLEDFRLKDYLSIEPNSKDWAPVVYSQHWRRGERILNWSPKATSKPCHLMINDTTRKKLIPAGIYILIKRISANDDRTGRCHACVVTPEMLPGDFWAIDNHIQIISLKGGESFSVQSAMKLVDYFGSEPVNHVFKVMSGTTQLNINDIELLRFPWKISTDKSVGKRNLLCKKKPSQSCWEGFRQEAVLLTGKH